MPRLSQTESRTTPQGESVRGELAIIEAIRRRAGAAHGSKALRLGIGDDCAILRVPRGHELLVTTDFSLEGRHFRRDTHPPHSIGHRALARGLSDIAAMGGRAEAVFLSLALPRSLADTAFLDGFLDGLLGLATRHKVSLAGGDTSEAPTDHLLVDIVVLGSTPAKRALRRSTAHSGDLVYVTGSLGGAATELATVLAGGSVGSDGDHPHLYPKPRLAVGQALLRRKLATACIDLSDGLSTDLHHLCMASGVGAELDTALLPTHALTVGLDDRTQIVNMLHGGEDYELLFTAAPLTQMPRSIAGVTITRIGRIVPWSGRRKGSRMTLLSDGTRFDLVPHGWEHLR